MINSEAILWQSTKVINNENPLTYLELCCLPFDRKEISCFERSIVLSFLVGRFVKFSHLQTVKLFNYSVKKINHIKGISQPNKTYYNIVSKEKIY